MSTSYIGSSALTSAVTPLTIPGFDVLNPYSYAATTSPAAANTLASTGTAAASTTSSGDPSSTASTSSNSSSTPSSGGLNQYQQALATLDSWQSQILGQSLEGDLSGATSALYSSAGLSADQFANLATELENLQTPSTGSIVNTSA